MITRGMLVNGFSAALGSGNSALVTESRILTTRVGTDALVRPARAARLSGIGDY